MVVELTSIVELIAQSANHSWKPSKEYIMAKQHPFAPGDKVLKANGKKTLTVTSVSGNYVYSRYDHSGQASYDHYANLKYVEEDTPAMAKDAIYKLNLDTDQTIFANYRGTDSTGNWLMERIGDGGGIIIVAKEKCEEVLPFTFSVRMNGREQHFVGEAGKLKKGDILLYTAGGVDNFAFAIVKNVDTKHKGARAWEGVRVLTEAI